MITQNATTARDQRTNRERTPTRSCSCGQQLDVCARAHCPRCGRTLPRG